MQRYVNFIASTPATNSTLVVLSGATCTIYVSGTTTLATLYSDNGITPLANPFLSSLTGQVAFYAANGTYDLVVSKIGYLTVTIDAIELDDLLAPSGSNSVGYLPAGTGAVATTVQTKLRESVSVKDFGAVGNGVADDTAAIQAAYAALPVNSALYFPSGTYKYTSRLTFSGGKKPAFIGDGPLQSVLLYAGTDNGDCIVVGDGTNSEANWYISGIGFLTNTATTSGAMVHFKRLIQSFIENTYFNYQLAGVKPYIAVWFDGVDIVSVTGTEAFGSQECLRVNGLISGPKADLLLNNAKIASGVVGVHIGGAFGGFYVDSCDIIANQTNVLIDQTVVAESNRETFFGPGCLIDSGGSGAPLLLNGVNIDIQDTGGFVILNNTWCASAGVLMRVGAAYSGDIVVNGGVWFNAFNVYGGPGDALQVNRVDASVTFNSVFFINVQGYIATESTVGASTKVRFNTCFYNQGNIASKLNNIGAVDQYIYTNTNQTFARKLVTGYSAPIAVPTDSVPAVTHALGIGIGGTVALPFYSNGAGLAWLDLAKSRSDTIGTQAIITAGDSLGAINFSGSDGVNFISAARIRALNAAGTTPAVNDIAGELEFATRAAAAANLTARAKFNLDGHFYPVTDNAYTCGANGFRWSAVWAANGTIQTSDENAKTDIVPASLGLDFVNALQPVSYKFKVGGNKVIGQEYLDENGDVIPEGEKVPENAVPGRVVAEPVPGKRTHWGLLAQQVKSVLPDGVDFGGWVKTDMEDPNSEEGLRYEEFIAPLIKAVQELSAKVAKLENTG